MPTPPSPRLRPAVASAIALLAALTARVARAQHLVPSPETTPPFSFDLPHAPLDEGGALVAWGHDVETRADRTLRVTPTAATAEPGTAGPDVADVCACAGVRWTVRVGSTPSSRTSVGPVGAPPVWSSGALTDVAVRCVAGRVLVGGVANGELVTRALTPVVGPERRTRVAPRGQYPSIKWAASTVDELFATVHSSVTGAAEVLRVAAGVVTHRRALGNRARVALALGPGGVLVATTSQDVRRLDLASFARADLAPGPSAALPFATGVELVGLWPGPLDRVAVGTRSGLFGPGIPEPASPIRTPRYGVAHLPLPAALRLWTPATRAVGPEVAVRADLSAAGWLGESFVIVAGAVTSLGPRGPVLERAGRVLRFRVAP